MRKAFIMAKKKKTESVVETPMVECDDELIIPATESLSEDYDMTDIPDVLDLQDEEVETFEDKEKRYAKAIITSYPIGDSYHAMEIHFDAANHFMKHYVKESKYAGATLLYFVAHYDTHDASWREPKSSEMVLYTIDNEMIKIKDTAAFNMMFPSLSVFENFCEDKGIVRWTRHYCFDGCSCKFHYCRASYVRLSGNIDTSEMFANAIVDRHVENIELGFDYHFRNSYYNFLHVSGKYDLNANVNFFQEMLRNYTITNDSFYDKLAGMYMHSRVFEEFLSVVENTRNELPTKGALKFCQMTAREIEQLNPTHDIVEIYHKLAILQRKENAFRREHGLKLTEY